MGRVDWSYMSRLRWKTADIHLSEQERVVDRVVFKGFDAD